VWRAALRQALKRYAQPFATLTVDASKRNKVLDTYHTNKFFANNPGSFIT
jgi:hypothetical protein